MERQILVPLDGSTLAEAAIPHAVQLALASSSNLHLLRTIIPAIVMPSLAWPLPAPVNIERWLDMEREAAQEYLAGMAVQLQALNIGVETSLIEGNPADTILKLAAEAKIRTIVMASHGRHGLERWIFGSVAEKVLHTTPVPLMVVHVDAANLQEDPPAKPAAAVQPLKQPYKTILVPLDGSDFAEKALVEAQLLAAQWDSTIVLLSVVPYLTHPGLGADGMTPVWTVGDQDSAHRYAQEYLDEVAQRLVPTHLNVRTRTVDGSPSEMIVASATEEAADLIVMSTHGHSGFSRIWLGSTTNRVIQHVHIPVLLVRAEEEAEHGR